VQTGPRPPTFDPAVLNRAAALPGMRVVAGLYGDQAVLNGQRTSVIAVNDLSALATIYRASATAGRLDRLGPDQLALSNEAATERGLHLGDRVTVRLARGDPHTYTVSARYAEDDLPGSFLLPREAVTDFTAPQPVIGLLQLDPGCRWARYNRRSRRCWRPAPRSPSPTGPASSSSRPASSTRC
jgi:putative ABC transport system permease protein